MIWSLSDQPQLRYSGKQEKPTTWTEQISRAAAGSSASRVSARELWSLRSRNTSSVSRTTACESLPVSMKRARQSRECRKQS